ncbi:hypothetical protein SLA2020_126780 [Shorea laevis]
MMIFTKLSAPLCLLFVFLCLKTAFSSSIHASSFSTTHLCSHEEALALLQFKTSFSINYTVSYPDSCGENYSKIESWKGGIDCCSWDGVSCDNVTGHVIALNLSCSFLYGTFPSNSTLFFLRNLQSLNLALNDFRLSKIPSKISQFTRLKHLDSSYSGFSGQVPGEIAHLPKLVSLNLSNDGLILETTTLRNLVQNLSEVRELVLSGVNMTSVNPRFFVNLSSSLTTLDLSESKLRGNFPNSIFHFPNLKNFYLGREFDLGEGGARNLTIDLLSGEFDLGEGGARNVTIDLLRSNWSSPLQQLYLSDVDCERRLPESIGDLKSLQSLTLSCNLEGSVPTSIGNLSQLTYLKLYSNNFNGQIPTSLANLTQLTFLDLSYNQFSGPIPPWIFTLPLLQYLSLNNNQFQGQINQFQQNSLTNLTQLTCLYLYNNQFFGPIPASIGNLSQLTYLSLSFNNFNGQTPSSLANLIQLTFLDLSYNQFSGPIPPWIFTLPLLWHLSLNNNQFQGKINQFQQNSLANLTQLSSLYLYNNQFFGPIPASIGNLSQLTHLGLSFNNFNGQIPSSLANLTQLTFLDLSYNHFSDLVASDMFSLQHSNFTLSKLTIVFLSSCNLSEFPIFLRHSNGLQSLGLSKNSIHGNIPKWICEKDDLQILDLSHNNLIGKIPNCLLKSLSVLNLQANYFDGNIPFGFPEGCGLRNLNLHGNQMDGLLPRSLVNCSWLEVLDVGNNSIKDTFPHWLESLPELQVLVLRSNKFHGFVQSTKESPSFPKLRVLDLSSNDFRGPLPVRYIENFKAMMDPHGEDGSPEYMKEPMREFLSIFTGCNNEGI